MATIIDTSILSGLLVPDVMDRVVLRQAANMMPIYAAHVAAGRLRRTSNENFRWEYDAHGTRSTQVNNGGSAYDGTTTAIVVDDSTVFYPNSLALCEATGEVMLVTAVNTGSHTLTVVRGLGTGSGETGVAAAAGSVANNAYLRCLGPANGESSDTPTPRVSGPSENKNWVQTLRQSYRVSGRLARLDTLTEPERLRQRAKKLDEIGQDIEHMLLHGAGDGSVTDAGGLKVTTSAGYLRAISTNKDNVAGAMNLNRFFTFSEKAFLRGSKRKWLFAGKTLSTYIHQLYAAKLQTRSGETATGLMITELITPHGVLDMIVHDGLTGAYAPDGVVIDPAETEIRFTEKDGNSGRLNLRENVQNPRSDYTEDEWFFEGGLQWGDEGAHAWLTGVTGIS